jgi:hypothetical protein
VQIILEYCEICNVKYIHSDNACTAANSDNTVTPCQICKYTRSVTRETKQNKIDKARVKEESIPVRDHERPSNAEEKRTRYQMDHATTAVPVHDHKKDIGTVQINKRNISYSQVLHSVQHTKVVPDRLAVQVQEKDPPSSAVPVVSSITLPVCQNPQT